MRRIFFSVGLCTWFAGSIVIVGSVGCQKPEQPEVIVGTTTTSENQNVVKNDNSSPTPVDHPEDLIKEVNDNGEKWLSEKKKIEEVAREEVVRRGWTGELEIDAQKNERGWSVTVWRLPKVPGGHCMIIISPEGKVLEYYPGE